MRPEAPPKTNLWKAVWWRVWRAAAYAGATCAASWSQVPSPVRRLVIFVIGSTVVLLGVIMLVTPGPAFVVIPLGLAILAVEFVWARRLLHRVRAHIDQTIAQAAERNRTGWFRRGKKKRHEQEPSA